MELNEEDIIYKSEKTPLIILKSHTKSTKKENAERLAKFLFTLYEMQQESILHGDDITTK